MFKIVRKKELNANVTMMDIEAPFIARKAKAGQFIIFRIDEPLLQRQRSPRSSRLRRRQRIPERGTHLAVGTKGAAAMRVRPPLCIYHADRYISER